MGLSKIAGLQCDSRAGSGRQLLAPKRNQEKQPLMMANVLLRTPINAFNLAIEVFDHPAYFVYSGTPALIVCTTPMSLMFMGSTFSGF